MKNSLSKLKKFFETRWSEEEYPGGKANFQPSLFFKEVGPYLFIVVVTIALSRSCDSSPDTKKRAAAQWQAMDSNRLESKTQIINFGRVGVGGGSPARRSPGTLVKVRLLNTVETYSTAPVHAQIIDEGLGQSLVGGTLIGDATPDSNFQRINISFRYARDPLRAGVAVTMAARALGLDGTLGLMANKKEGFFTRSAIGSANSAHQETQGGSSTSDLKEILFKALTAGLVQEFGSSAQVEKNRSQVLTLPPSTIFFAELTDFFPGGAR